MDFLLGVIGGAFNPIKTLEDNFLFWERTAKNAFELRSRRYLDGIDLGSDAAPAAADIDGDGDLDLLVGSKIDSRTNGAGPLYLFRNAGTRTAPRFEAAPPIALGDAFNLVPALGDLDGDGDLDLILGTWNKDVLYGRNEGSAREPRWVVDDTMTIKPPRLSHAAPALADIDTDGDLDLFLGQASGHVAFYRNTGTRDEAAIHTRQRKAGRRPGPDDARRLRPLTSMAMGSWTSSLDTRTRALPSCIGMPARRTAPRFVPHVALTRRAAASLGSALRRPRR